MSKFSTTLQTQYEALLAALPKGSTVHAVTLNPETKNVVVLWDNEIFESGLTVPVDFELEEIKKKRLPAGVRDARKPAPKPPEPKPVETDANVTIAAPLPPAPKYLTQDEVIAAGLSGKSVEFMGVEIGWKPFAHGVSQYTEGFFYRLTE